MGKNIALTYRISELFIQTHSITGDAMSLFNLLDGVVIRDGWVRNLTDENWFDEGFNGAGGLFYFWQVPYLRFRSN